MNRKLNLVIPVDIKEGVTYWVHSTPISLEIFEAYHRPIALAFTRMYGGGLNGTGHRIAMMILRSAAKELGMWDGKDGVNLGLIAEINRISNVIMPAEKGGGWTVVPLEDALRKDLFTEDDVSELENAIAFFIVASAMHRKSNQRDILDAVASFWGLQSTLLNSTAFKDTLPTSTETENSGEKATPSRIPQ